eukprot:GHRQ01026997.1.p3 GENE.GHRQ01026997.1~~GHRQ01026997.1.p3  ORF type:complete len:151 (+),score=43.10 GHRQ01026997.1:388-840(+)
MRGLALLGQQQMLQGSSTMRSSRACSGRLVPLRPCQAAAAGARRAVSRHSSGRTSAVRVAASLDYIATASDDGVLKLPARTELDAEEIKSVYGYPRYAWLSITVQSASGCAHVCAVHSLNASATHVAHADAACAGVHISLSSSSHCSCHL